jgi:hypothetical protein
MSIASFKMKGLVFSTELKNKCTNCTSSCGLFLTWGKKKTGLRTLMYHVPTFLEACQYPDTFKQGQQGVVNNLWNLSKRIAPRTYQKEAVCAIPLEKLKFKTKMNYQSFSCQLTSFCPYNIKTISVLRDCPFKDERRAREGLSEQSIARFKRGVIREGSDRQTDTKWFYFKESRRDCCGRRGGWRVGMDAGWSVIYKWEIPGQGGNFSDSWDNWPPFFF